MKNTRNLILGIVIGIVVILVLIFSLNNLSTKNNVKESPNIEIACSFSQNPDTANSPTNAIKCKFRNYGGDGEECFLIGEYKVVNGSKEDFLGESNLCSGNLSIGDYWSDYKYIYNSKSWEDYNLQEWAGWACGVGVEMDCLYQNNIERVTYRIKTSQIN